MTRKVRPTFNAALHDGQPVRRKLVATFNGPDYEARRADGVLGIYFQPADGVVEAARLVASFEGQAYVSEQEDDGLVVYLMTSETLNTNTIGDSSARGGALPGRPGPQTARAMRGSTPNMTAERYHRTVVEPTRKGEKLPVVKDRAGTHNPQAGGIQAMSERLRGSDFWGTK